MLPATGHNGTDVDQWIGRARRAEPEALNPLLESYRNYLRFLASTAVGADLRGKAEPSDLVQEVLLKAHRHFGQFRGDTEAELAGWLRRTLARTLSDFARRFRKTAARQVGRERSLEALLDDSSQALERLLVADGDTPSGDAQRRELRGVLADALAELSADQREVLVLRSLEERSWDEVALKMGRTAGAVRLLWVRALKRLRPLLEARL